VFASAVYFQMYALATAALLGHPGWGLLGLNPTSLVALIPLCGGILPCGEPAVGSASRTAHMLAQHRSYFSTFLAFCRWCAELVKVLPGWIQQLFSR